MGIRRRRGIGYTDNLTSIWNLLIWGGLFAGLGFGIFYAVQRVQSHAQGHVDSTPDMLKAKPRRTPAPPPGPAARAPAVPQKPRADQVAGELNLAVLAREAARYRADRAAEDRFLGDANSARNRLEELKRSGAEAPEHLEPSDAVEAFQDVDLTRMEPAEAGEHLARAARSVPPGTFYKVRIKRHGQPKDVLLYFPARGGADVAVGETAPVVWISNDLAKEINHSLLSLGPDQLRKDERKKIEVILGEGKASREDYEWLVRRMAKDDTGYLFDERQAIEEAIGKLQAMLPSTPVPDAILTKLGARISGTIVKETPTATTLQTVLMPLTFDVDEIRFKWTGKDLREEFDRKLKTADKLPEAYPQLLLWCKEWNMPVHRELAAYYRILQDRNDRVARLAAGYVSSGEGRWVQRGSIAQTGRAPEALRRPESRAEMQPLLEQFGFRMHRDRWVRHVPWSAGLHTLWENGNVSMKHQGMVPMNWYEWDTPLSRKVNPTGKPKNPSEQPTLRFLAPSGPTGQTAITVEAPNDLLDCQVKAVGTIVEGGHRARVEVRVDVGVGKPHLLYSLDEGTNDGWHNLTALLAGRRRFMVVATLTAGPEKYPYARYLSSLSGSKETFWVRGTVLEPAPEADKLWQSARP
jgi:hypothetical protein